jgi:diguanylate cyclase (GGDEF)-like protein
VLRNKNTTRYLFFLFVCISALTAVFCERKYIVISLQIAGLITFATTTILLSKEREKCEKALTHITGKLQRINNITQLLLSTVKLNELMKMTVENLTRYSGFEEAFVYVLEGDEISGKLRCIATKSIFHPKGIERFTLSTDSTLIQKIFHNLAPYIIHNIDLETEIDNRVFFINTLRLKQFIVLPLHVHGHNLGIIIIGNTKILPAPFDKEKLETLTLIANHAGIAIENARLYEKIQELTITDGLTNVYNYRYFQTKIHEYLGLAGRYNQPLSLCIMDIDDFKHYNDTNGHLAGDTLLRELVNVIKSHIRKTDILARYGGEEFVLILSATDKDGAVTLVEKLRKEIEIYPFIARETQPQGRITISSGIATYPEDAQSARELIEIADKRLYIAKKKGKNYTEGYAKVTQLGTAMEAT